MLWGISTSIRHLSITSNVERGIPDILNVNYGLVKTPKTKQFFLLVKLVFF